MMRRLIDQGHSVGEGNQRHLIRSTNSLDRCVVHLILAVCAYASKTIRSYVSWAYQWIARRYIW